MQKTILNKIQNNQHVLIIGKESSGKTHFAINNLLPFLTANNLNTTYFKDCDNLNPNQDADTYIIDEVEILGDKDFLEQQHPNQTPFYPDPYLAKVKTWHAKLAQIQKPTILIVARNADPEIDNLIANYKNLEWNNAPVEIIKFER